MPLGPGFLIGRDQINRRTAKRLAKFPKRHHRRIASAALQRANILLPQPRLFGELFLCQPPAQADFPNVSPNQSPHIHAATVTVA